MEQGERELSASERRLLKRRVSGLAKKRRTLGRRVARALVIVIGSLWIATMLLSDAPRWLVSLLWLCVGAALATWIALEERRSLKKAIAAVHEALEKNTALVTRVRSRAVVEVEELEDEGACWLFDLEDGQLLLVSGQEYYATSRFPNDDFSLIRILREDGSVFDTVLQIDGQRLRADRKLPASARRKLPSADEPVVHPGSFLDGPVLSGVDDGAELAT